MHGNKKDILKYIEDMPQSYKQSFYDVVTDYFNKELRSKILKELPVEDQKVVVTVFNCISVVSETDVRLEYNNAEFHRVYSLLKKSKVQGSFDKELVSIYERKREEAYNYIRIKRGRIVKEILGEQFTNYQKIKNKKTDVASNIFNKCAEKATETCKEKFNAIQTTITLFEYQAIGFKLESSLFKAEVKGFDFLKLASLLILRPKYSMVNLIKLESEWENFPLKWFCLTKSVSENRYIYSRYKEGIDVSFVFTSQYEDNRFTNLRNALKEKWLTPPLSHVLCCRSDIIKEVLTCYKKKLYAAAVCTSLTLIEGMLWDFSREYDLAGNKIYNDHDKGSVLLLSGKEVDEVTIGMLIKQTEFSKALDINFIDYFCGELYSERNPILHGRDTANFDKNNAAKKIATIEYILAVVKNFHEKSVMQKLDENIPVELKEMVLSMLSQQKVN
ncbi:hypothetical protein H5A34_20260 [Pectobacterium brasiliense]|uniref:hypothetical protein n=1 Tax=Pectobacterium brasiliense TaxID=180957 RepID=UPI001968ECC4|nr:hypothetical protein [Pectobacterium brasiliense]MBN3069007.1 hypothetical protein [Pectobacterium brasiliense]MBN3248455.1 hypothetical protein [Pectobacterium brasiliense]